MDELLAFVRARIEQERADATAAAKAYDSAAGGAEPTWWAGPDDAGGDADLVYRGRGTDLAVICRVLPGPGTARHVARQDPAATLTRCDALSAVLERLDTVEAFEGQRLGDDLVPLLAAIWRTHPDYRTEWET